MSGNHKIDFKTLKSRVGVDDVAYALGYRLDRKAGVGRYIELVLGEGSNKRDTIIVSNPHNKAAQTFFRRDGSKGDVVSLIRENLNSFFVRGDNEWHKVAKVMARFANMPEPEFKEDREYVRTSAVSRQFEADRYELKEVTANRIPRILAERGFSYDTVKAFEPYLTMIHDTRNEGFDGYNIGFPYTMHGNDDIQGYEIRGLSGYKSKAAGTNSNTASWVVNFSSGNVKNVYFFESGFDAMAFYEVNRLKLDSSIALVSIGGTFSDNQVLDIIKRFPKARLNDCFDNDIPGRIYGLRLMALAENLPIKISKTDNGLIVESRDMQLEVSPKRPIRVQMSESFKLRSRYAEWTAPKAYKDWNDCLLNNPIAPILTPNKHERDNNLAEQRKSSLKI